MGSTRGVRTRSTVTSTEVVMATDASRWATSSNVPKRR